MPTYEYACTSCGHRLEAVQSFSDDPLTTCPDCGGPLRKVYGAVGIVLKGSGFYKTDSRSSSSVSSNGSGEKKSDAPKKESGSSTGSSDKGSGTTKSEGSKAAAAS